MVMFCESRMSWVLLGVKLVCGNNWRRCWNGWCVWVSLLVEW